VDGVTDLYGSTPVTSGRGGAPLSLRLARVTLRSCTCGVVLHVHTRHDLLCAYRMVLEAAIEIERMRRALKANGYRKSATLWGATTKGDKDGE